MKASRKCVLVQRLAESYMLVQMGAPYKIHAAGCKHAKSNDRQNLVPHLGADSVEEARLLCVADEMDKGGSDSDRLVSVCKCAKG